MGVIEKEPGINHLAVDIEEIAHPSSVSATDNLGRDRVSPPTNSFHNPVDGKVHGRQPKENEGYHIAGLLESVDSLKKGLVCKVGIQCEAMVLTLESGDLLEQKSTGPNVQGYSLKPVKGFGNFVRIHEGDVFGNEAGRACGLTPPFGPARI